MTKTQTGMVRLALSIAIASELDMIDAYTTGNKINDGTVYRYIPAENRNEVRRCKNRIAEWRKLLKEIK